MYKFKKLDQAWQKLRNVTEIFYYLQGQQPWTTGQLYVLHVAVAPMYRDPKSDSDSDSAYGIFGNSWRIVRIIAIIANLVIWGVNQMLWTWFQDVDSQDKNVVVKLTYDRLTLTQPSGVEFLTQGKWICYTNFTVTDPNENENFRNQFCWKFGVS